MIRTVALVVLLASPIGPASPAQAKEASPQAWAKFGDQLADLSASLTQAEAALVQTDQK